MRSIHEQAVLGMSRVDFTNFALSAPSMRGCVWPQPQICHQKTEMSYLNIYTRLSLSRTSWTLWNTSRYPYIDISDLRKWGKQLIEQPLLTEWICNLTPKLELYWKYCGKEEQFLLFSTILCRLLVDLCVKTGTRFSLRDKRLFEISEFEITRVDCIMTLHLSKSFKCF